MIITAQIIPATRISMDKNQVFSYAIPESLKDKLKPGYIVEIPFGNRTVAGVVTQITKAQPVMYKLKEVHKILWDEAVFTPQLFELAKFISGKYLVSLGLVVKTIITKKAPRAKQIEKFLDIVRQEQNHKLTDPQEQSLVEILDSKSQARTFLLHGVTGSGKTEVYIQVIQKLLKEKKQSLVLVPEIALTPQTLARFSARFKNQEIGVIHSKISYGQKYLIWSKVFTGEIKILIGPRSAIFAPFKNLGLIVIDEEHDSSYKQFDQSPRFHTREVAGKLSEIWNCPVILGDATPSVETFYNAQLGRYGYLELASRINQALPPVKLVDMAEVARGGNFSIFSDQLISEMEVALKKQMQVILFINRRGMATGMMCGDCGKQLFCKSCQVTLVYHKNIHKLICHHCNRKYSVPITCAHCKSNKLKFTGTGTEKVEEHIQELFPKNIVKRLDKDTISTRVDLENFYEDFKNKKFDILVGTQIIAKGWDLSSVGLIGVVNSDTTLQFPDFRSNERTFQLITQVAGRTGRGEFPGRVVLQTYNPQNFAVQAAVTHDYVKFFEQEIQDRKDYGYPPFSQLIKLTYKSFNKNKAEEKAQDIVKNLRSFVIPDPDKDGRAGLESGHKEVQNPKTWIPDPARHRYASGVAGGQVRDDKVEIIGPSPAFIPRVRGSYIYYVIIKVKEPEALKNIKKILEQLPADWDIDVDPSTLL